MNSINSLTVQNLINHLNLFNPELPVFYSAYDEDDTEIFVPITRFLEVVELTDLTANAEDFVITVSEPDENTVELPFYKLEPDIDGEENQITTVQELLCSLEAVDDKSIPVLIFGYHDEEFSENNYDTLSQIEVIQHSDYYDQDYPAVRCVVEDQEVLADPTNPLIVLF